MLIRIKVIYIIFLSVLLTGCQNEKSPQKTILPEKIYQEELISINAIQDSININSDTLFFAISIYMQDTRVYNGYIKMKDGMGTFFVPKEAAYITGYFYSLKERDNKNYDRLIYDKNTNKEVINAYQENVTEEQMYKELENYPNNLIAYISNLKYLREKVYLGEVSDTTFSRVAQNYLDNISQNANSESQSDMYSLIVAYVYNDKYTEAEQLLYEMIKTYPNSYLLKRAYDSYWVNSFLYREDKYNSEIFLDSLDRYIARHVSQTSPLYISNSISPAKEKYYKSKEIANSIDFFLREIDSTDMMKKSALIQALIKSEQLSKARIAAKEYVKYVKGGGWQHFKITNTKATDGFAKQGTKIGKAYKFLADVSEAEGDYIEAIEYLDSAYAYYRTDKQNKFIKNPIRDALNMKGSIYKRMNQPNQVLKTYETLYEETKDERVLDSIKVLFLEMQQEEGFEDYVISLKNNNEDNKLAKNFSIKDMTGYDIKLSEWKNRVVVLNFWANYCLPCADEIPLLNELWRKTQSKDIIFLAITKDSPLVVKRFAKRQREMFAFSVVPEAKELYDKYDVNLIPTQIIINKKGEIVKRLTGLKESRENLKRLVLEELEK